MEDVILRRATEEDLDWLLEVENDASHWAVGERTHSYSRVDLAEFLSLNNDLVSNGYMRWIICSEFEMFGVLDLFEYDQEHRLASVGILISEMRFRRQGFGQQALQIMEDIAFGELGLKALRAVVQSDNMASQGLFTKAGYMFKRKVEKERFIFQKEKP